MKIPEECEQEVEDIKWEISLQKLILHNYETADYKPFDHEDDEKALKRTIARLELALAERLAAKQFTDQHKQEVAKIEEEIKDIQTAIGEHLGWKPSWQRILVARQLALAELKRGMKP